MANWTEPTKQERREWKKFLKGMSPAIQQCVHEHEFTPWKLYRLISSEGEIQQRVTIASFIEPDGKPDAWACPAHRGCGCKYEQYSEVTLTVFVSAEYNTVGFERRVGPVLPSDLVECDLPAIGEPVGSANLTEEERKLAPSAIRALLQERAGNLRPYGITAAPNN